MRVGGLSRSRSSGCGPFLSKHRSTSRSFWSRRPTGCLASTGLRLNHGVRMSSIVEKRRASRRWQSRPGSCGQHGACFIGKGAYLWTLTGLPATRCGNQAEQITPANRRQPLRHDRVVRRLAHMPIKIYAKDNPRDEIAWLCGGDWSLPRQISALESWLGDDGKNLSSGQYIADIGFSVRKDAGGGGAAISPETLRAMADRGIWLFLSEYPSDEEDTT